MLNNAVVIPPALRAKVLRILHLAHPGIVRTKALARNKLWWPSMSQDIETFCKNCTACIKVNVSATKSIHVPWRRPKYPSERVHLDVFHFRCKVFLIFCDAFSKWIHVKPLPNSTAETVIKELHSVFAIWGYPSKLVTNNGPPFQSKDFKLFCTKCNILCCIIPVNSPESNGFAEKSVCTAKKAMSKLVIDLEAAAGSITDFQLNSCVSRFLFNYRNTPSSVTGKAPNELLLAFAPRTELSLLHPKCLSSCNNANFSIFREGDAVSVTVGRNPSMEGIVVRQCGVGSPLYLVSIAGVLKKVHANQLVHAPISGRLQ